MTVNLPTTPEGAESRIAKMFPKISYTERMIILNILTNVQGASEKRGAERERKKMQDESLCHTVTPFPLTATVAPAPIRYRPYRAGVNYEDIPF